MDWYLKVVTNYVGFEGRARRKEFWMFVLFNSIISLVIGILDRVIGVNHFLGGIYSLGMFLPILAVNTRRLHDTGRSGWMQLLGLIPLIGQIILIVFYCQDSKGTNQYGPNPKGKLL